MTISVVKPSPAWGKGLSGGGGKGLHNSGPRLQKTKKAVFIQSCTRASRLLFALWNSSITTPNLIASQYGKKRITF